MNPICTPPSEKDSSHFKLTLRKKTVLNKTLLVIADTIGNPVALYRSLLLHAFEIAGQSRQ